MALVVARIDERGEVVSEVTLTRAATTTIGPGALFVVARDASGDAVALVTDAAHRTLVNGQPMPLGLRVLGRADECRTEDGAAWRFVGDRGTEVVAFAAGERQVRCRRCTVEIDAGTPSVQCPVCGQWFHEQADADLRCWSSIPFCGHCGHPTADPRAGSAGGA